MEKAPEGSKISIQAETWPMAGKLVEKSIVTKLERVGHTADGSIVVRDENHRCYTVSMRALSTAEEAEMRDLLAANESKPGSTALID